jgi:hypothetical protein
MTIEQIEEIVDQVTEQDGFQCDQTTEILNRLREL